MTVDRRGATMIAPRASGQLGSKLFDCVPKV
jgi:hypothetical protein